MSALSYLFTLTLILTSVLTSQMRAQEGDYSHRSYFDNNANRWWVEVSSYRTRQMSCTVNWDGIKLGMASEGAGQTISGRFVLTVPKYPGKPAPASMNRGAINKVGNFKYSILCN